MIDPELPVGWLRPLGTNGPTVSAVSAGAAPLGSMPENFGYEVTEDDAVRLVEEILGSPIRSIDTANSYSHGRSESRVGKGIARSGGLPDDFLVTTKVDARGRDYSGPRVRQSVDESMARLGMSHLPVVYLHDPEFFDFDELTAPGGAVETLVALRASGTLGRIGVAGGDVREMRRYLDLGVFDVLLSHNRWTLVDRSAGALIDAADKAGVAVVNAAVYGGGVLASPNSPISSYGYRPVHPVTADAIVSMNEACRKRGIALSVAALQFSVRDERIASTVVGFSKTSRITSILDDLRIDIHPDLWKELESLTPPARLWLDAE
jgi:D-threo-aldose 1-dehydrogenase